MSTQINQATAKIIDFPRRPAMSGLRRHTDQAPLRERLPVEAASGWYHEAAIRDADGLRKR